MLIYVNHIRKKHFWIILQNLPKMVNIPLLDNKQCVRCRKQSLYIYISWQIKNKMASARRHTVAMATKEDIIKRVNDYHLVVKAQDKLISFFAYKDEHHLSRTYDEEEIKTDLRLFETIEELYDYMKQEPQSMLRIEEANLICLVNVGKKKRQVKIPLNQSIMTKEKAVKIKLKNASFEFKKLSAEIQATEARLKVKEEQIDKNSAVQAKLLKGNRRLERLLKQSEQRTQFLTEETKKEEQALKALEEMATRLKSIRDDKTRKNPRSILFSNK